ncbi:Nitrogen regulatory protein P-II [Phycisphaerae bacterium RAS2]|jgi:nitrogen regulatory protein P-II 2|nr:Nitrogen regulatory protein P-II [Phycisphaerae bacterium RAS2]
MKLIIAIIRPEQLEAVQAALRAVLDEGDNYRMTIASVEGHGQQQGEVEFFRGQVVRAPMARKLQITIGVNDPYVEPTVQAIVQGARSGKGEVGDGKIFIMPLEDCVRIRTGERGGQAI